MPLNFDSVLGFHAEALKVHAKRSEVLAANIANADTPNYKAQDLDFKTALNKAGQTNSGLRVTHARHISVGGSASALVTESRKQSQPSLDGNTVDTQVEAAKFAENSLQYQAQLQFLNGKISSLRAAIRGD